MIGRFTFAIGLLAVAACERQPAAPISIPDQARFATEAEAAGPPPARSFGPDTRETGVDRGDHVQPGLSCTALDGRRRCTGYLASDVDQTRLDVTLDVPAGAGPHALVVLLHGWAGGKHNQSDIAELLLADGHAVLRYSARGFGNSYGLVNLADIGVEISDLRSMIGQIVEMPHDGFSLNPGAVAVGGASYGGGQSWLAALDPVFQRTPPDGPTVKIRAIVPIVPWSDLLYSLVPNGHPRSSVDPPGALKLSYVNALYSSGCRNPPLCTNYPLYLKTWHAWLNASEPTNQDPIYAQIRDGLAGYRSIWWQQDFWRDAAANGVAVFQVQGFTDDLFTLEEAKRMLLALETVDPAYPITSYFGDIGHPRARNKPGEVEYALGLMRSWLNAHLRDDVARPAPAIYAAITRPADRPFSSGDVIKVDRYADLSTSVVSETFDGVATLVNPASGLGGAPSDPLFQAGLEAGLVGAGELMEYTGPLTVPDVPDPTAAVYEVPVAKLGRGSAILIAGQPSVTLELSTLAPRVQINVRLFDVAPGGRRRLVTRGTYTLDRGDLSPIGSARVSIPTQGNLWEAAVNHRLQLEVSNVDAPYIAPSRVASVTQITGVRLDVPVR